MKSIPLRDELSQSIQPGDNFYKYVNQKWLATHPIPSNKTRVGVFTMLEDDNTKRLRKLLESPGGNSEPLNIARLKTFYRTAMDKATIEQAGIQPLQPILDAIARIDTRQALKAFIGTWHSRGLGLVWHIGIEVDNKQSSRYAVAIDQGGLGLPDREYYEAEGEYFKRVRNEYHHFLSRLLNKLGSVHAEMQAGLILALETRLAHASNTATEDRDVMTRYNPYDLDRLHSAYPTFDWIEYLSDTGLKAQTEILISQPRFMETVVQLLEEVPLEIWRAYLTCHCLLPLLTTLPKAFNDLHFTFYGKVLGGVTRQEVRAHRIIKRCMNLLPEPAGQLFVQAHFNETAKIAIYDLVDHIRLALRNRIEKLTWMTDKTKQRAYRKLDTFLPLLGYPDTWRPYDALRLSNVYVENFLAVKRFDWEYDLERLHHGVDRKQWLMSPALVNAYYWSNTNGITFPAGILQPPLFDSQGDFAANYGGIGVVIGHEITHGFDDQGSRFDEEGNLVSWWTDEDRETFTMLAKQLETQYSSYEVEGRQVNGALTLGENIADLGGTLIAYDALQRKLREGQQGEQDTIDGFTPEQRFFISLARIWRGQLRPELALRFLVTDPHAPNMLRVNAVLANIDAFYDVFHISTDAAWFKAPRNRITLW